MKNLCETGTQILHVAPADASDTILYMYSGKSPCIFKGAWYVMTSLAVLQNYIDYLLVISDIFAYSFIAHNIDISILNILSIKSLHRLGLIRVSDQLSVLSLRKRFDLIILLLEDLTQHVGVITYINVNWNSAK